MKFQKVITALLALILTGSVLLLLALELFNLWKKPSTLQKRWILI